VRNLKPAIDLIKHFEGLYLKAYKDPVGVPTIGYGTIVYPNGKKVKLGDVITEKQAEELLAHEISYQEKYVKAYITAPLNDNQYGAILSFVFNRGAGRLRDSKIRSALNRGDYAGAALEIENFKVNKTDNLKGLIRRRKAEADLFRTPTIDKHYLSAYKDPIVFLTPTEGDKMQFNRNKAVLLKAAGEIGVKEAAGKKDNPRIVEYQAHSTVSNKKGWADSVPWCSTFICWVVEKVGMISTNSAAARSWEKWGVSVKSNPLPGDIVVFWRETLASGKGHVTIFLEKKGDLLYCLGGNQADSVNISTYPTTKLRDIRRSSKASKYTLSEITELKSIAKKIMDGKKVDQSGKVV
jgi:lysozyme